MWLALCYKQLVLNWRLEKVAATESCRAAFLRSELRKTEHDDRLISALLKKRAHGFALLEYF
jgi:hypothetical protein